MVELFEAPVEQLLFARQIQQEQVGDDCGEREQAQAGAESDQQREHTEPARFARDGYDKAESVHFGQLAIHCFIHLEFVGIPERFL